MADSLIRASAAFAMAVITSQMVPSAEPATASGKPQIGSWGVDLSARDLSVKPGDNFFLYANGSWLKSAHVPMDRTGTGSFQDLVVLSETRIASIIDELETMPIATLTPEEEKLRNFYDAYTDVAAIERRGLAPEKGDLRSLMSLRTHSQVARAMASVPLSTASLFGLNIGVDDKNPNSRSVNLVQSGLGLPDRDFYLRDDPALASTREAYRAYLAKMLSLIGARNVEARATHIFNLETAIAKAEWSRAARRDRDKVYNPMSLSALRTLAPGFPWSAFLRGAGIPLRNRAGERQVIVAEKSAFPALAKLFITTPVSVWRDYLVVHYLHTFASILPKRFDDADFAFYDEVIRGQTQQLPRSIRAQHLLDAAMGEALGKLFVTRYFAPSAKVKARLLVANLMNAYAADIRTLSWMSEATRQKALYKLAHYTLKIGYPDRWRDYSALRISRDDLLGDMQRIAEFAWRRDLDRLDEPVDKDEWLMSPQTVNAYYSPVFNEIVFPAAILQPPLFDPNADDAVNYGAIGAVIGHEISHGFDDQGSKYDANGVLVNWWTAEDRKEFSERADALSAQFDAFEPLPGIHIVGKNTLGENIADLAGLAVALEAYRYSLHGTPAPLIDGISGDQRFFLGFAQLWRTKLRDSTIRSQTISNNHSVPEFRAIGPTRNLDEWYEAFNVKPGDSYYLPPEQRIRLW